MVLPLGIDDSFKFTDSRSLTTLVETLSFPSAEESSQSTGSLSLTSFESPSHELKLPLPVGLSVVVTEANANPAGAARRARETMVAATARLVKRETCLEIFMIPIN